MSSPGQPERRYGRTGRAPSALMPALSCGAGAHAAPGPDLLSERVIGQLPPRGASMPPVPRPAAWLSGTGSFISLLAHWIALPRYSVNDRKVRT